MTDRFDLEQKILNTFDVVEDIKLVNKHIKDTKLEALATLWALKVDDLWETFEEYIKDEAGKRGKDGNA